MNGGGVWGFSWFLDLGLGLWGFWVLKCFLAKNGGVVVVMVVVVGFSMMVLVLAPWRGKMTLKKCYENLIFRNFVFGLWVLNGGGGWWL